MATETKLVEKEPKILSPIHKSLLAVFKKLRSHPILARHMKKKLPLVNEIDSHGTKCVIVYIKSYILAAMKKIVPLLRIEVEKNLGKQVYFIGYRRIIPKPDKRTAAAKVHRPFRRTVTGVHQSMLEDLVYPSEIMGKRTLYRPNSSKLIKIFLDLQKKEEFEGRLRCLSDVYKRLTRRDVKFEFPLYDCPMRLLETGSSKKEKLSHL
ncbi:hypothetical protein MXB_2650 [Myxobolus squamalis]|nr:hypothetical protein MXB_2650 [Myxobolus squamalis]